MGRDAASDELRQLQIGRLEDALFKLPAFLATQDAANIIVGEFGFDGLQLFKEEIVIETVLLEAVGFGLREIAEEVVGKERVVGGDVCHLEMAAHGAAPQLLLLVRKIGI